MDRSANCCRMCNVSIAVQLSVHRSANCSKVCRVCIAVQLSTSWQQSASQSTQMQPAPRPPIPMQNIIASTSSSSSFSWPCSHIIITILWPPIPMQNIIAIIIILFFLVATFLLQKLLYQITSFLYLAIFGGTG